ncbi:hypothetical protein D9756_001152 [Leucocoprinus leucothites]|uniref:F-box domain-containing protein n=1 Tax=Leucocoprinus leucothites TaxID=201217 RepID=A0A8H5GEH0_9AGAR|nr:hypothetical protein D9756_001152 [Leucoagaricus leucothites]
MSVSTNTTSADCLPDDILQEIFPAHLLSDPDDLALHKLSTIRTHLRLVCRRWNSIVVHTPRCWSTIHFCLYRLPRIPRRDPPPPPKTLALFLKRSQNTPLFIKIYSSDPATANTYGEYLDLLSNTVDRWVTLVLEVRIEGYHESDFHSELLKRCPLERATGLGHLSCNNNNRLGCYFNSIFTPTHNGPPVPHHLALCGPREFPSRFRSLLDGFYDNLTSLFITDTFAKDVIPTLRMTPRIISLHADIFELDFILNNDTINLPCLRYLSLVASDRHTLLEFLEVPLLTELRICLEFGGAPDNCRPKYLLDHLARARHSLRVLVLCAIGANRLVGFFQHPSIVMLPTAKVFSNSSTLSREFLKSVEKADSDFKARYRATKVRGRFQLGWVDETTVDSLFLKNGVQEHMEEMLIQYAGHWNDAVYNA